MDPRLARLLGVHTQTRPVIINALWQYIKTHKLQDQHEREYINCDKYLEQVILTLKRSEKQRTKFRSAKTKIIELASRVDPDEVAHNEPPQMDLLCLMSGF